MRILFIHGFGENEAIFSKIAPFIGGKHIFLNVWTLLGDAPRPTVNVLDFAKEVVQKYNITKDDAIIGHSMGGWIAYHIKHWTDSPIVQIGSWTDTDRPLLPITNEQIIYWFVRNGLYLNRFNKWVFTLRSYKGKPSKEIFQDTFDRLIHGNKENVLNQLRLILTPIPETVKATPDLRIHAKRDAVVRPPREPFHEVVGDHFTLYTHPENVYEPIVAFLASKKLGTPQL
jgi:hypothetical protein